MVITAYCLLLFVLVLAGDFISSRIEPAAARSAGVEQMIRPYGTHAQEEHSDQVFSRSSNAWLTTV